MPYERKAEPNELRSRGPAYSVGCAGTYPYPWGPSRYRFGDAEKLYWLTAVLTAAARFRYSLAVSGQCRKSQRPTACESVIE